ncbi:MAG: hypothetical protein WAL21_08840 [Nitrososphaeraceae archaeon]
MVEKAQQTGSAVGQRQDSIVESRLRIVPSRFHAKDMNNSPCSGKSTSLLLFSLVSSIQLIFKTISCPPIDIPTTILMSSLIRNKIIGWYFNTSIQSA